MLLTINGEERNQNTAANMNCKKLQQQSKYSYTDRSFKRHYHVVTFPQAVGIGATKRCGDDKRKIHQRLR